MSKRCLVIIPVYKQLNEAEVFAIKRNCSILNEFDMGIMIPEDFIVDDVIKLYPKFKIYRFPSKCFNSINDYNELVLKADFYNRFIDYEYILITQLDVLILRNNLADFLKLNYDYIGAPWLNGYKYIHRISGGVISKIYNKLYNKLTKRPLVYVGNGGFSLRRVSTFINVTTKYSDFIELYSDINEDVVFSWLGLLNPHDLRIADVDTALKFAFETDLRKCYELSGYSIPLGIHAWERYDKDFALELLKKL